MTPKQAEIPFFAIGNQELGEPLSPGDRIKCPVCQGYHIIESQSPVLSFYRCGKNAYLAGIMGKAIP
jgi:hypothetical protein